ncbi:hypothetical protein PaeBR_09695 [Paenibacillus sp. BR2-3]|uniref:hypothetical protein n=1 Tax=Paenibacillus sp. BR2-3 TaxID=3048494 RepID=UPI00397774D5
MSKNKNGGQEENQELSAADYAIIGAALVTLGDFFSFLSLIKAREVTKEAGGETDIVPTVLIQSKKRGKPNFRSK